MIITIILLSVLGICGVFYLYLKSNLNYWSKRGISGPKPALLVGNLSSLFTQKVHIAYEYDKIYNDYKKDHSVVGLFAATTPQLMLLDPVLIKEVLVKNFKAFMDNFFAGIADEKSDPLLSRDPFGLCGEKWKTVRNEVTPAFTSTRIKSLQPIFDDVSGRLTKYIKKNNDENPGKSYDIKELIAKYTTDVVSNCVFALDAESFKTEKPLFREMARKMTSFTYKLQFILFMMTLFPKLMSCIKLSIIPKDVEKFFVKIVQDAVKYRKVNKIERTDYLDYLIKLHEKNQITDTAIAGSGVSFFGNGFETTSIVMSYCFFDLANNPECQKKLRAEIVEVCELKGGLTYDNCHDMVYLDQTFHESVRLHPMIIGQMKKCVESIDLIDSKDKKIHVEKGTVVVVPMHAIFRDESYFQNALNYDPDRFSPENGGIKAYTDRFVFFPFSEGPRICLGMGFAKAVMKRGIAEIVKKFEITISNKTQLPLIHDPKQFLNVPRGGIWLDFKPIVRN